MISYLAIMVIIKKDIILTINYIYFNLNPALTLCYRMTEYLDSVSDLHLYPLLFSFGYEWQFVNLEKAWNKPFTLKSCSYAFTMHLL